MCSESMSWQLGVPCVVMGVAPCQAADPGQSEKRVCGLVSAQVSVGRASFVGYAFNAMAVVHPTAPENLMHLGV